MPRLAPILLTVVAALVGAASASAQTPTTYPLGRLVPPELAEPPATIPRAPIGEYPEDWAECLAKNPPPPQTYPRDLDVRGADPAAPNPLVGTKWFVDRMEPAYTQWARWKRAGQTTDADTIWRL